MHNKEIEVRFKKLRKKIERVFRLTPVPLYRLSDAIIADDYGDDSYAFEETWLTWIEIKDWQVAKCDMLFSFAPPKIAAYFIPRYMIYVLDEIEGVVDQNYVDWGQGSGYALIWFLIKSQKNNYEDLELMSVQLDVIEEFLLKIKIDDDYRIVLEP